MTKGKSKVVFRSKRAFGYGDGDTSDETLKLISVRFDGEEVKADEITGDYYDLEYLVAPQDLTGFKFLFEIFSENPNLTGKEKTEMFDIVASFKS